MGGGIEEQQPGVPTQDFGSLEEDRANHPPMAWEEEGPSGATQASGTKASASKGHSRTSPLGESEGGLGSPTRWWEVGQGLLSPARNCKCWGPAPAECGLCARLCEPCLQGTHRHNKDDLLTRVISPLILTPWWVGIIISIYLLKKLRFRERN